MIKDAFGSISIFDTYQKEKKCFHIVRLVILSLFVRIDRKSAFWEVERNKLKYSFFFLGEVLWWILLRKNWNTFIMIIFLSVKWLFHVAKWKVKEKKRIFFRNI